MVKIESKSDGIVGIFLCATFLCVVLSTGLNCRHQITNVVIGSNQKCCEGLAILIPAPSGLPARLRVKIWPPGEPREALTLHRGQPTRHSTQLIYVLSIGFIDTPRIEHMIN